MGESKKYNINNIENGGYNYAKMEQDENSHVCNFSIPLKSGHIVNGRIRMISHEGDSWAKLVDVTEKIIQNEKPSCQKCKSNDIIIDTFHRHA